MVSSKFNLPPEQQAIRDKCLHPSGAFVEFPLEDVENSIPARFEKIVALHANRIAVKTEPCVATYRQLNEMANRFAHALFQTPGRRTQVVALLLEKDVAQIAAMLGAMKAGKFFLILDPTFPKARLAQMLQGSRAKLIVTNRRNASLARDIAGDACETLQWESLDGSTFVNNLAIPIAPKSLAFINYTSGSTGEPKGLLQSHRIILHNVMLRTNLVHVCAHDRISLLSSGTCNAITNSLLALLNGAGLYSLELKKEALVQLARWFAEERITIGPMSSSLFRSLCETLKGNQNFPDLRVIRLRSEAVYKSDVDLYKQYFSKNCIFVTGLSSNETGPLADYLIDHQTHLIDSAVPIGYPAPGKDLILLNQAGERIGFDEVGEIAVRSRYLSPGYLRNARLVKAKFKPDPTESGSRIYLTGDMGLMLPTGCFIYKGRKDFRVKVRGYPVDIREVEIALRNQPRIRDAVVVARSNRAGDTVLVAYFVADSEDAPTVSELRSFLRRMLPDYIIPGAFVRLARLPLNPQNKTDRTALPPPPETRPDLSVPFMAPHDEDEQEIATIWAEILGIDRVGIQDNFFDLSGHSLAAIRIVTRVVEKFNCEFPLQLLFDSSTVEKMAAVIRETQSVGHRHPDRIAAKTGNEVVTYATNGKPLLSSVSSDAQLPLSFSQQQLWFLDQLDPGSFTYNLASAYRLKGDLNITALEQSVNEIIRRHEVLRTVFKAEDGSPVQVILPNLAIKIPLLDLVGDSSDEQWTQARRLFTEEAQRPFDLAVGPLLRFTLLQLAPDDSILLRIMHHIVSDGWSGGVLSFELAEIYRAAVIGQASPLADLPIQYANYVKWQRDWFTGDRFRSQLSYWKKQLDNIETLNLPIDHRREAFGSRLGARRYYALSERLTSQLKNFSREQGATLFMTLVAAFQTLLHRYSNQTDIAIGSPVAGRNLQEFERLIGFFINMLVLRLDLSGHPTFVEVLGRAREMCLEALSHQELPFEKLVEEMHPNRSLANNPLFQVTFAFQNTPRVLPQLSGTTVDELQVEPGIARFDLHLFMEEIDGHLQGYCDYDIGLFNADTIERMLGHFENLLEAIADDPSRRISDLPLLSESERQQILVDWKRTRREYPGEKCLHDLFEEQVKRTPEAVAVVYEDQELTYAKLNRRANQLAHYLRRQGVGPEVLVGLCVERSLEMVVGLLGIVKAGGAYVPLDPSYPQERLAFMMEDARVGVLLTQQGVGKNLPRHDVRVVKLDRDWSEIAKESEENPEKQVSGENLAYVIYTSGSTGIPKGVMITHQAACNHMLWMQTEIPLESTDCVLQKTALNFDASVWEIYAPLLAGARFAVAPPEAHRDSRALLDQLTRHKVTVLQVVPSLLKAMLAEESFENCASLKRLFCGGEVLTAELAVEFMARADAQLYNLYGPTEATIDATCGVCSRTMTTARSVPIGRPIANTQIYILDSQLNPVPIGVTGEIHIGGIGLARGYLNRPELTAERFIYHSFDEGPEQRLYKTGDRARYLPDGNIEFLGRIDDQVKIRGYRIELGEIECVLKQHPGIEQAVVVAREDDSGDRRLVAYCVAAEGHALNIDDAKRFLRTKLPAYMLPAAWVKLPSLPRLPNGKVDRASLPTPEKVKPERLDVISVAWTPLEKLLAQVWAELLPHAEFGIEDNFFELGGHSLLATRVVARLSKILSAEIPLRFLFEAPTIRELALRIAAHQETRLAAEESLYELKSLTGGETQTII